MYGFMYLMNFLPFISIAAIIGLVVWVNRGGQILVLKEFHLNKDEDEFLRISGRPSGIIAWISSSIGVDPVTSLCCNHESIKFEKAAFWHGKKTLAIPIVTVTGISSGIDKPFVLLFLGIIFIVGGVIAANYFSRYSVGTAVSVFFIGSIIGIIFLVLYKLRKAMFFSIYNGGDKPIATICMKKSIIEGQSIDELKFEAAANDLNKAVLESHHI